MSLYNEMRPMKFKNVKGQEKIIKILKENITSGHLPNAMLFVGTRGTGKTTVARIVAKTLNCEHLDAEGECCDSCPSCMAIKSGTSIDVLELDAASNNGVEHVRAIIEKVQFNPIGKMRIIIADEVHMFTTNAFNALLKIMEEPPKDTLFILCTTEVHKIPATILSRCRKFQFETVSEQLIVEKLEEINHVYQLEAEKEALFIVAKAAKGSMRDAESIYESFLDIEGGKITATTVRDMLGYTNTELVFSVLNSIMEGEPTDAFYAVHRIMETGGSLTYFIEECFRVLLDVISIQASGDISTLAMDKEYLEHISKIAFNSSMERLIEIADGFRKVYENKAGNMELAFQGMILSLLCSHSTISVLEKRIHSLEKELYTLKENGFISLADKPKDCVEEMTLHQTEEQVQKQDTDAVQDDTMTDEIVETSDSFQELDAEQLAELASLGFAVEEESLTDDMVYPSAEMAKSKEETDTYATSSNKDSLFGSFARLFEGFQWTFE